MNVEQATHIPTTARQSSRAWTARSYDLLLVMGLAIALPVLALLSIPLLRVPLGLIAVLFAPGYALTVVLFPRQNDLDDHARTALSFGLSITIIPISAIVLNTMPWGIQPLSITIASSIWMLVLSAIGLVQHRSAASLEDAYVPPSAHPVRWWQSLDKRTKIFSIISACILLSLISGTALGVLLPNATEHMTEFYMLGSEGLAENYPRESVVNQDVQIQLGINNHEGTTAHYRIEAMADGQVLSQMSGITIGNDATWEGALHYTLTHLGDDQRIDVLLFRNNESNPYRQLALWMKVRR